MEILTDLLYSFHFSFSPNFLSPDACKDRTQDGVASGLERKKQSKEEIWAHLEEWNSRNEPNEAVLEQGRRDGRVCHPRREETSRDEGGRERSLGGEEVGTPHGDFTKVATRRGDKQLSVK